MRRVTLGVLCGLLAAACAATSGTGSQTGAREALRAAPRARKHAKLDSRLAALAQLRASAAPVRVEVLSAQPGRARARVARSGGRVEAAYGRLLEAVVPAAELEGLARDRSVRFVREPARPVAEAVHGEGVVSTGAAAWLAGGSRGKGSRIAVVDLGFHGFRQSQASGELPASAIRVDFCSGGFEATEHGTAVAEIVAEMAPAARLYLICAQTVAALGQAKDYARAQGIQIVNHSASWFNTSRGDGSGGPDTPAGIVADARNAGILWVNAAGNRAQQHWSGGFVDDDGDGWNEFAPGDEGNTIVVPAGMRSCAALKWDDWPASSEDYDLYLMSTGGAALASSTTMQQGTEPPTELLCYQNTSTSAQSYSLAIYRARASGRAVRFDLFVYPGPNLEHQVADGSVTEPGSSASALTVGAVCWQNDGLEPYSSRGPTIDGRVKPDIAGPDVVSSFVYGRFAGCGAPSAFAGTSAASPHVAAAAALVKGANPSFSADELQAFLESRAVDLGAAGKDTTFGAGKLMLGAAPRLPQRACVVPAVVGRRLTEARSSIRRSGCEVGRVRRARSRVRRGRVVAQSPHARKRLAPRTRVSLTVSRGRR